MSYPLILLAVYAASLFTPVECKRAASIRADGYATTWRYFSDSLECITALAQKSRVFLIHANDIHSCSIPRLARNLSEIYPFCEQYPDVKCLISRGLEDACKGKKYNVRASRLFRRNRPANVVAVSNSLVDHHPGGAFRLREFHGLESSTAQVLSNDGPWSMRLHPGDNGIPCSRIAEGFKASPRAKIHALWVSEVSNGLFKTGDRFRIPRKKRNPRLRVQDIKPINQCIKQLKAVKK